MHPPCEIVVKLVLPAFRSLVARRLAKEYKLSQTEIAALLGITQASISFYLSSRRGKGIEVLEENPEISRLAGEAAKLLYEGAESSELERIFCEVCMAVRSMKELDRIEALANGGSKIEARKNPGKRGFGWQA